MQEFNPPVLCRCADSGILERNLPNLELLEPAERNSLCSQTRLFPKKLLVKILY